MLITPCKPKAQVKAESLLNQQRWATPIVAGIIKRLSAVSA